MSKRLFEEKEKDEPPLKLFKIMKSDNHYMGYKPLIVKNSFGYKPLIVKKSASKEINIINPNELKPRRSTFDLMKKVIKNAEKVQQYRYSMNDYVCCTYSMQMNNIIYILHL